MSTEFYADYIKKTTFDPESHSTRSKMEEHHEKDENGKVIEHPVEEAATDVKKKPASKTPKVEVEPTEVPEENMAEKKSLASLRNASVFDGKERLKKMQPKKPAIKPLTTTYQAEATFKVNVEGLPTMYIDGTGAGEIKSSLRKQLKDPKTITSIEKISTSEKKKELRAKVSEEDRVDEISNRAKGAYVRVAARDLAHQSSKATSAIYNNDSKDSKRQDIRNADRKRDNRMQGIDRATKGMKNEDAESVDELSRDTLGSYIQKASDASKHKGMSTKKVDNRYSGVSKASMKIDKMEEDYSDQKAHLKKVGKGGQVSYTNSGKKMSGEYGGLKNKGGRSYAMVHHKTHSAMVPLPQINHKESVEATDEGIMDAISKVKQGASNMVSDYKKKRNIADPGKGTNYLKK